MFAKLPATLAFSVNDNVFPATTVPLVALNVNVGLAFAIVHLNVFVPVALSLHLYPLARVAVIVYVPALV